MPYIKKDRKVEIDKQFKNLLLANEGELNYAICSLFMRYIDDNLDGLLAYRHLNSGLGAIIAAHDEIYLRLVRPFERTKQLENGDIFQEFIRKHNLREV